MFECQPKFVEQIQMIMMEHVKHRTLEGRITEFSGTGSVKQNVILIRCL